MALIMLICGVNICCNEVHATREGLLRLDSMREFFLPPAIEANVITQPFQPFCQVLTDVVLHVVDVGRSCKLIPSCSIAFALELAVIDHNGFCIPCHLASKNIPDAVLVLLLSTAVVDDDVTENLQAFTLQLVHTPASDSQVSGATSLTL